MYLWPDWLYNVFRNYLRKEFYGIHTHETIVKIKNNITTNALYYVQY